jgi:hypothetical protein
VIIHASRIDGGTAPRIPFGYIRILLFFSEPESNKTQIINNMCFFKSTDLLLGRGRKKQATSG